MENLIYKFNLCTHNLTNFQLFSFEFIFYNALYLSVFDSSFFIISHQSSSFLPTPKIEMSECFENVVKNNRTFLTFGCSIFNNWSHCIVTRKISAHGWREISFLAIQLMLMVGCWIWRHISHKFWSNMYFQITIIILESFIS